VIASAFFRFIWVTTALVLAIGMALVVLFALGAIWVGDELRAAAPGDPVIDLGAPWFGAVLFAGTVAPALTALPAILAAMVGEVLRVRSWLYYVPAGGAALAVVPLLTGAPPADLPALPALPPGQYLSIFAAAGFAGGFVYWLLAGRRA
jgi:hypothetical protein